MHRHPVAYDLKTTVLCAGCRFRPLSRSRRSMSVDRARLLGSLLSRRGGGSRYGAAGVAQAARGCMWWMLSRKGDRCGAQGDRSVV